MKNEQTALEKLVVEIQEAGQGWVEAKLKSDQLEADEKNFLAALINDLEKSWDYAPGQVIRYEGKRPPVLSLPKLTEAKLERMARGSQDFRSYVTGRVIAQAETNRKKIRYEALLNLFEAHRSSLAFERAKIEKGIFHIGK